MDPLTIKRLLRYQRYLFTRLELFAMYDRRVMDSNTHCELIPIQKLVHILNTNTSHSMSYMDVLHIE